MAVKGAVLGDIAGSQFEFNKPAHVDWEHCDLFSAYCSYTDDTVMTLAVKKALMRGDDLVSVMQRLGRKYPDAGYGGSFYRWLRSRDPRPYNSWGNGSAMRVSFVGEHYDDFSEVVRMAEKTAEVTHNHPEGIKGAIVTASCIWMARHGKSKQEIYDYVLQEYPPSRYQFTIEQDIAYLEKHYSWDVSCMTSVPLAMRCFYESDSFESFMRNIFRLNCDSDTFGAIAGGVAEEYYHGFGFDPDPILRRYLTNYLYTILMDEE